ncbi:MAG: diguanylate cyclase [Pseudomonadota bacterium]
MHFVDFIWAAVAAAALVYPLRRLIPHIQRVNARDLAFMLIILTVYPMLLAVFHLTPFDLGLVYSLTTFIPALYFFSMTRYVGVKLPHTAAWRVTLFSLSGVLAVLALTNEWHGLFAEFEPHVPGQPNHLLDDLSPKIGMGIMHALSLALVLSAVVLALMQFLRSRLRPTQVVLAVILPTLGLLSFTSNQRWSLLSDAGVSGFILTTTAVLLVTNYAFMRNQFIEVRVVTRSRLMHMLPDAMLVLSGSGRVLDGNPAFADLIRCPLDEAIDHNVADFLPTIQQQLDTQFADQFDLELNVDGSRRYLHGQIQRIDGAFGVGQYLVLLRDVTESEAAKVALAASENKLKLANAALMRLSTTDELTGLLNRRALLQAIERAMDQQKRSGKRFSLLILDVDLFKSVNDQFGHSAGDQALCHVARILEAECRSTDQLARYGGEEFIVLLADGGQDVMAAAERFRKAVENSVLTLESKDKVELTVSVGGVTCNESQTVQTLMKSADAALYEAKHAGRNRSRVV